MSSKKHVFSFNKSNFKEKYLKYKKKYLALKNQLGGYVITDELIKNAAQINNDAGLYEIANILRTGNMENQQNTLKSIEVFHYLADNKNHADSQYFLGDLYEYGYNVKQVDPNKSLEYYNKASIQGQPNAIEKIRTLQQIGILPAVQPAVPASSSQGFKFGVQPVAPASSSQGFKFGVQPAVPASSSQGFKFGVQPAAPASSSQGFKFGVQPTQAKSSNAGLTIEEDQQRLRDEHQQRFLKRMAALAQTTPAASAAYAEPAASAAYAEPAASAAYASPAASAAYASPAASAYAEPASASHIKKGLALFNSTRIKKLPAAPANMYGNKDLILCLINILFDENALDDASTYEWYEKIKNKKVVIVDFANIVMYLHDKYTRDGNVYSIESRIHHAFFDFFNKMFKENREIIIIAKPIHGISMQDCMEYCKSNGFDINKLGKIHIYNTNVNAGYDEQYNQVYGDGLDDFLFWLIAIAVANITSNIRENIVLLTRDKQKLCQNQGGKSPEKQFFSEIFGRYNKDTNEISIRKTMATQYVISPNVMLTDNFFNEIIEIFIASYRHIKGARGSDNLIDATARELCKLYNRFLDNTINYQRANIQIRTLFEFYRGLVKLPNICDILYGCEHYNNSSILCLVYIKLIQRIIYGDNEIIDDDTLVSYFTK